MGVRFKRPSDVQRVRRRAGGPPNLVDLLVSGANQPKLRMILSARAKARNPWQVAFVNNLAARYRRFGENEFVMTEPQRTALRQIIMPRGAG
jgi:hypothetical protein